MSSLGRMCLSGVGGPVATADGVAWLEKAASTNTPQRLMATYRASEALATLEVIYERGLHGVPADPEPASVLKTRLMEIRDAIDAELGDDEWSVATTRDKGSTKRPFRYANANEAKATLRAHMETYRRRTYGEMVALLKKPEVTRLRTPGGSEYEVKVDVHWEDQPGGSIWVTGSINDYGWCAGQDIHEIFVLAPDGTIVGDSG